jgi:cytochrome b561
MWLCHHSIVVVSCSNQQIDIFKHKNSMTSLDCSSFTFILSVFFKRVWSRRTTKHQHQQQDIEIYLKKHTEALHFFLFLLMIMVTIVKWEKKNESKRVDFCLVLIESKKKSEYDWHYMNENMFLTATILQNSFLFRIYYSYLCD